MVDLTYTLSAGSVYGDGTINETSSIWKVTNYIDVSNVHKIKFQGENLKNDSTSQVGFAFFDNSQTYIDGYQYKRTETTSAEPYEYIVNVPANAKYVMITINKNRDSTFYINGWENDSGNMTIKVKNAILSFKPESPANFPES